MSRNMMKWVDEMIAAPVKKPMPILSFPAVTKMNVTVNDLIRSSDLQAQAMKLVADETPAGAASVSMMDLSVEAEAFGAQVKFSDHEVPAVVGCIVDDDKAVAYHNCGKTVTKAADIIASMGCRLLHFGNSIDIEEMLRQIPSDILVMGNIDPAGYFRNGTPEEMRQAVLGLLDRCSSWHNWVISSGCDIPPLSGWENIHAFYAAVEAYYSASVKS